MLRIIKVPYDSGGRDRRMGRGCIRSFASRHRLVGASITAYDPDCDVEDKGLNVSLSLIELFAQLAID